jgi:hypothetical protein
MTMKNMRILICLLLMGCSILAAVPQLPTVKAGASDYDYDLGGAYNEQGFKTTEDYNATLYRETEGQFNVTNLNGIYNYTGTKGLVWKWHLANNDTRTYYLGGATGGANETIYVIVPAQPWYSYSFDVIDFIGVEWGYLESLININGTARVVERWGLDVINELPFVMTWGAVYQMRLVCDRGTYYYPDFVAGADLSQVLQITSEMFPESGQDIDVTVTASRVNTTYIQSTYVDGNSSSTSWIYMAIYEYGNTTVLTSVNQSTYSLTWNWYGADSTTSYYVNVTSSHTVRGILTWVLMCPVPVTDDNPWSVLTYFLGDEWVIPAQHILGYGMCFLVGGSFSRKNAGVGIVSMIIVAAFLTYIGWLSFTYDWLVISLAVAILVAFSIHKEEVRYV